MKTYFFYDIETTGLNKAFDQVVQFAAIRTDQDLNEIDRHMMTVKLRPDIIPSPYAMITHRITLEELSEGLCEFEAICKIHALMNTPGTISIGYNSLGFDDEFLRFSFYRNLLSPYTHQYKDGCGRMDMLVFATLYCLYKNEVLKWPKIDNLTTLKLEHLSSSNDLSAGQAHNAMNDVEALLNLTRVFYKQQQMWDYVALSFDKNVDKERMEKLPIIFESESCIHKLSLIIDNLYGAKNQYQVPVLSIGNSIPYKNQTLWFRLDLEPLSESIVSNIAESTKFIIRKKYGEPGTVLPPYKRFMDRLDSERMELANSNIKWLQSNEGIFRQLIQFHREFEYPLIPNLDQDAALYQNGFPSSYEQKLFTTFHASSLDKKLKMIDQFPKPETQELACRIFFRNYNIENVPDHILQKWHSYMEKVDPFTEDNVLLDYRGQKRMTPSDALREIEIIRKDKLLDKQQEELLTDLSQYLLEQFNNKSEIAE